MLTQSPSHGVNCYYHYNITCVAEKVFYQLLYQQIIIWQQAYIKNDITPDRLRGVGGGVPQICGVIVTNSGQCFMAASHGLAIWVQRVQIPIHKVCQ